MHSISRKLTIMIVLAALIPSILIGVVSVGSLWRVVDQYADKDLVTSIDAAAQKLDSKFRATEQAVSIMRMVAETKLTSADDLAGDPEYYEQYTKEMYDSFDVIARNAPEIASYYYRYCPEVTSAKDSGFYYIRGDKGDFEYAPPSIIEAVKSEDDFSLDWYFKAIEVGHSVWTTPYLSSVEGVYFTTFSTPIYKDGVLVGVVGADIYVSGIADIISTIDTRSGGIAYLVDKSGVLIYHPDIEPGHRVPYNDEGYKLFQKKLENGMILCIAADQSAVYEDARKLAGRQAAILITLIIAIGVIGYILAKRIARPLRELNDAAKQISEGKYDVEVSTNRSDELGELGRSVEVAARKLKAHDEIMKGLAYTDSLTGLKNNTSYRLLCNDLDEEIRFNEEGSGFTVVVFDLNCLKWVNDMYGHDAGNKLIIGAVKFIGKVFGKDNLYRIGGDEFALVIRNADEDLLVTQMEKFKAEMPNQSIEYTGNKIPISIACGAAKFISLEDEQYVDVFERADRLMYENKTMIKSTSGMDFR